MDGCTLACDPAVESVVPPVAEGFAPVMFVVVPVAGSPDASSPDAGVTASALFVAALLACGNAAVGVSASPVTGGAVFAAGAAVPAMGEDATVVGVASAPVNGEDIPAAAYGVDKDASVGSAVAPVLHYLIAFENFAAL